VDIFSSSVERISNDGELALLLCLTSAELMIPF